ncbi:MAG TPA: DPP IV N-terminal domain-containing protein [Acidisarcina sp.]
MTKNRKSRFVRSLRTDGSGDFTWPMIVVLFLASGFLALTAQTAPPLSVAAIYGHGSLTGNPPSGFAWAPDSSKALYRSDDGDLMAVDATGKSTMLISHTRLNVLTSSPASEKDRDHRARYGQPDYIWGPDSDHILLNTMGDLTLYSPKTSTGLQIASTGMGSGDDPKFSPNGSYVSYIRDHNIYLRRLRAQGQEVPLSKVKEGIRDLSPDPSRLVLNGEVDWVYEEELAVHSNYFWSPDSRRIAYLQMDESNVPEYPITDWIPIHPSVDRQPYPVPGDANPIVRVGVVSADGGKTNWIKLPFQSGNDYIPRFGWVNQKILWIETLSRDQKHLDLYFADVQSGMTRLVLSRMDAKFFDADYDVDFASSEFFLTSWQDGHTHIYRYSFNQSNPMSSEARLVKQLTAGDYDVSSIGAIDEPGGSIYYLSNEDDPLGQQAWSVQFDGKEKHQLTRDPGFHEANFSAEGGLYLDTASDAATPPQVSFCHKQDCHVIWKSTPLGFKLSPIQRLELKNGDGAGLLYGSLLLPPGGATMGSRSVPLIVNPYGGPGAQGVKDEWGGQGRLFDELLAERGYAVLHVDNRGMAARGRDFAQAAYRNFGPVQLSDQLAAVDQVLAKYPQLDSKRLGWWGWSWGGSFTLYALTHSDRFRVGIAGAPVTDWRDYDSIYTERYLGLPPENAEVYHDESAVNSAANLKGHLLLLHGTGDDNVHLENSVQFIQKLIEADIPYDFQIYPRKTHSVRGADVRMHMHARMLDYFDQYLKPVTP